VLDHLPNGIEFAYCVHSRCLLSVITIMMIDPLGHNAFIQLMLYVYSRCDLILMQCPKCGATWESPDGANERQFVICKDCSRN
jgi:hypothetical protein